MKNKIWEIWISGLCYSFTVKASAKDEWEKEARTFYLPAVGNSAAQFTTFTVLKRCRDGREEQGRGDTGVTASTHLWEGH